MRAINYKSNRRFAKVYLYEFEYISTQLADLPHNVRLETGPSVVDWYRKRSLPLPWYIACYGDFSRDPVKICTINTKVSVGDPIKNALSLFEVVDSSNATPTFT